MSAGQQGRPVGAGTWTCQCGATNRPRARYCGECGTSHHGGGTSPRESSTPRGFCDCGAPVDDRGMCQATGGYPVSMRCPFACPICRGPLDWSGGCDRCHGCDTGRREDWTFPGDRYELDKQHWQRVDGPRKACTPAENAAGFAAIRAILAKAPLMQDPTRERRRER